MIVVYAWRVDFPYFSSSSSSSSTTQTLASRSYCYSCSKRYRIKWKTNAFYIDLFSISLNSIHWTMYDICMNIFIHSTCKPQSSIIIIYVQLIYIFNNIFAIVSTVSILHFVGILGTVRLVRLRLQFSLQMMPNVYAQTSTLAIHWKKIRAFRGCIAITYKTTILKFNGRVFWIDLFVKIFVENFCFHMSGAIFIRFELIYVSIGVFLSIEIGINAVLVSFSFFFFLLLILTTVLSLSLSTFSTYSPCRFLHRFEVALPHILTVICYASV